MFSLNRATIIGHLTRDPELRTTPNGQSVTSFSIATNRRWTDASGGTQKAAEFHDIVAWGKLAEIASTLLHKGDRTYLEGRLQTRSWEGQDGARRSKTEIVAENLINLSPKRPMGTQDLRGEENQDVAREERVKEKVAPIKEKTKEEIVNIDDIPF